MAIAVWQGPPRSYTPGRIRQIQYIVIHFTAGSEGPNSAENGASYDRIRTDGVSTHCFADSNSVVREVNDGDRAHACFNKGNNLGLQLEICGTAQTREQWLDKYSYPTLQMAAKQCAEWCRDHKLPVRRLTVEQTRAAWYAPEGQRPFGFVGHSDVTQAYPEDGGDHMDPGPEFPWDVLFDLVKIELGGGNDVGSYNIETELYSIMQMSDTVTVQPAAPPPDPGLPAPATFPNPLVAFLKNLGAQVNQIAADVAAIKASGVTADVELDDADLAEIKDAAREGAAEGAPSAQQIADAVVDEEHDRLAN